MRSNLATIQSAVSEAKRTHSNRGVIIHTPFFEYNGLMRDLPVADLRNRLVDYLNGLGFTAKRRPPKPKAGKRGKRRRR